MSIYKTGTVSVTNGSATVTGTGTNWLGQVAPGQVFALVGEVSYTIASVASDTSLTLTAPYGGTTKSGQTYSVTRDFTTGGLPLLAPGTVSASGVLNPVVQALEDANNARLKSANNLSDLANANTARANLGLGSAAVQPDTRYAHRANNLSDLANAPTARNNLGLGTAATQPTSRFPYVVGSVAELEAASLPVGQEIYLSQEGRAGNFIVKAGTPPSDPQKGIYIILANGNYAIREYIDEIVVDWFGAVADGTTDSTTAIQAAIDIASGSENQSIVVLLAGVYLVSSPLQIGQGHHIRGAGIALTSLRTQSNAINAFEITSNARLLSISSMAIASQEGIGTSNSGIYCDPANGGAEHHYKDLYINSFKYGIHCADIWWNNTVENVRWNSCGISFFCDATLGQSINNLFLRCYSNEPVEMGYRISAMKNSNFVSCNNGGVQSNNSIYVRIGTNCFGVNFIGCNFENILLGEDVGGISVLSGSVVTFDGCVFQKNKVGTGVSRAFEISARDTSKVTVRNCVRLSEAGVRAVYTINDSQLLLSQSPSMEDILSFSSNSPLLANRALKRAEEAWERKEILSGKSTGVTSGSYIDTGKGTQLNSISFTVETASGGYPEVSVGTDERDGTGRAKIRFTNLSDGTPNTGGSFDVLWMAT